MIKVEFDPGPRSKDAASYHVSREGTAGFML